MSRGQRLTSEQRMALREATDSALVPHLCLWARAGASGPCPTFSTRTVRSLERRGLLRHTRDGYVLTEDGRLEVFTLDGGRG